MKPQNLIPFTKMEGTGNDFIVIDNRSGFLSGGETDLFASWCRRRTGIGADGILFLEKGKRVRFRMRYVNSDGFEVAMCGNGARCLALYIRETGLVQTNSFEIENRESVFPVFVSGTEVSVRMPSPQGTDTLPGIIVHSGLEEAGFVLAGVPHYVLLAEDVDSVDIQNLGSFYRNHKQFPEGTNVDFIRIEDRSRIRIRTYERGVEGETLSCGTGAVASAYLVWKKVGGDSPTTLITRGGILQVAYEKDWTEVTLKGPARIVYQGSIQMESKREEGSEE